MKLHIGCASTKLAGYVNIDIRKTEATDVVTPAWDLKMFDDGSIDQIYCRHAFEHLDPNEGRVALTEWLRVLKAGGTVNIVVPDLVFHCRQLLERSHDPKELQHALAGFYGWRDEKRGGNAHDSHKWGYTHATLRALLTQSGFTKISRRTTGVDTGPHHLNVDAAK